MIEKLDLVFSVGQNVASNVLVMLFLMLIGYYFTKKGIFTDAGVKQMTELALCVSVPCLIINSYQREFDITMAKNLALAIIFAFAIHIVYILISAVIFKKTEDKRDRISKFSVIYSNCGFMALPLVQAIYGETGVFYAVAYVTVFNMIYWTQGVYLYTNDIKQLSFKKIIFNPGVLGAIIGITLFALKITLPTPLGKTVSFMASVNTPLPMVVMGTYLVNLNIKKILKNGSLWAVTLLRLIIFPIITMLILKTLNWEGIISMPLILASASPVAAVATLFAVRYGLDSEYSTQAVSFTTLLSIITIPLVMMLATLIM